MAVWAFAVRPERQRFTLLQKAPCGFALIAQQEREEKAPSEMKDEERCKKKKKNQLPKFWGLSKSAQSLALACFSLGAPARPSCSCYEANSHICWEDRRWDRKTLNKAAKTGWHNNPLLCLRGAESWDVRVCNWMSDLVFFCSIEMVVVVVIAGVFGEGESDVIKYQLWCETCWFFIVFFVFF